MQIDLNSDLGESLGPWKMGDDAAMLGVVSSANVACGFHAGDPAGILKTLRRAAECGVAVGAHVAYRDLLGFGRRPMDVESADLIADVIYQIGALKGLAAAAGTTVRYVKPHGALYNTIAHDARQAADVLTAMREVDPSLCLVALAGSPLLRQAEAAGVRAVAEAFADRAYTPQGTLVSRRQAGAVLHDAVAVAERMLRFANERTVVAVDGSVVKLEAASICVHGDSPGAVEMARQVKARLAAAGVEIRPFVDTAGAAVTMRFLPVNLDAFLVELDDLAQTLALFASLQAEPIAGVDEVVPAARTLLVRFRPGRVDAAALAAAIGGRSLTGAPARAERRIEIAVHYDGDDLAEVARMLGVSAEEVVRRHTGRDYTVAFTGFAPGFAYLADGDPGLDVPRRSVPRTRIPAGAVALGGRFSGVYPRASPGGWQIIGVTDVPMWDLGRPVPALLQPGDTVRFVDVGLERVPRPVAERPTTALETVGGTPLRIVAAGLQALFQDAGRGGRAGQGVSASGAMDRRSLQAANRLVGNPSDSVCIEAAYGGLRLAAEGDAVVAVTGADGPLTLVPASGAPRDLPRWQPFALAAGDTITFGEPRAGLRSYLAVRGGFAVAPVLGSGSTDTLADVGPAPLASGDVVRVLPVGAGGIVGEPEAPAADLPSLGDVAVLDVVIGPRDDWFTPESLALFSRQLWQVTPQSNRVGLRLAGEVPLARTNPAELPSEGTLRGSIQVPASGQAGAVHGRPPADRRLPGHRLGRDPPSRPRRPGAGRCAHPLQSDRAGFDRPGSPVMKKVLIANRGEIAVRIARACTDYGAASVAVYADPDFDALHTRVADEAWSLGGERPADTYLDAAKLLAVAARAGADAVHPGYGFLSESAAFAQAVIDAGLTWIGPPPAAIAALGDKVEARRLALSVGAPLVPGTPGPVAGAAEVLAFAEAHGLPIAIKAAFGGGGRGIKVVRRMDEVEGAYESAVREAITAFGRGECFVERFLDRPRHVEAQVLADTHGRVVVLGTRDCSLQRRNQKLVEEAPAPFLTEAQRQRIHGSARDICAAAGYVGAGTVEYCSASTA